MRSICWFLPVVMCVTVGAQNAGPDRAPDTITYITHVTVIDTETGKEITDQTVVISGDKISDVANSENVVAPTSARIVDGRGKFLIPGLWDMHVHGTNYESTLPLYVANGVTGVREMFGPPDANKFRAELSAKNIVAPHVYLGSPILDGNPPILANSIKVERADQARRIVDEQKKRGADFIKVYSRLSREAYFAIMDEAQRQNIPVAGHVPDRITAWEAIHVKQKSMEHLIGMPYACSSREEQLWPGAAKALTMLEGDKLEIEAFRSYSETKCNRLFDELKTNGTWAVPTLMPYKTIPLLNDAKFRSDIRMKYFGGEFRDWLNAKDDPRLTSWTTGDFELERKLFRDEQGLVGELFRAGVPLLAGTDAGNPYCFPGFSLHDELALLVESGLTPLAALQAATLNSAVFMNATDRYGSIAKGKTADLVLLDADPLHDIHNTTKISEVFLSGREFDRASLDRLLKSAEEEANKEGKLALNETANQPSMASSTQSNDNPASVFPGQIEGNFIIKDFHFNSGEVLPEIRLHYVTLGTPHRNVHGEVDNAVLLLHSTGSDTTELLEPSLSGPLYGPGEPLDLKKFYLIIPDCIGHGKSSKPSDGLRAHFPHYGYNDMVTAQYRLVTEKLRVAHLRMVLGLSMGAMHTWLWGERYPDMMDGLFPISGLPSEIGGRNRLWRHMIVEAIRNDPEWKNGGL